MADFAPAREVAALVMLAAVILWSFGDSIIAGLVAAEKDTRVFFFPLHTWVSEELKMGRIPLWNPYIFAGYPIFADGEMGLAHPLHLALLTLLSVEQAFIWQRVSSGLIAAASMYALCRALRLGHLAAILGALTFTLGSFFASQQHHENVTRTAAWLPLTLGCVEWGLHRPGWRRHAFFTAGALALGMAALGLHPQLLAMSLLGFATFVVLRVTLGPVGGEEFPSPSTGEGEGGGGGPAAPNDHGFIRGPLRARPRAILRGLSVGVSRLALIIWIGGYVGGLGLALAAVQLLPLAELGVETYRGSHPEYFFATSYALPVQNLVNLLLPYFFRGPDAQYWSLWAKWETTVYVGIAPLLLGTLALTALRREVLCFIALAAGGLWLAFASYAPFDLYHLLWQIPGFSAFRVPGRYTYLFVLAAAVLAAFGLQSLVDAHRDRSGTRRLILFVFVGCLALESLALFGAMLALREVLVANSSSALAWLQEAYLSLRHHPEGIAVQDVYRGLIHSLTPETPRTLFALGIVPLVLVLIAAAALARPLQRWARLVLVGVAALDLLWFGIGLHAKASIEQLIERTPAVGFLERCRARGPDCGPLASSPSVLSGPEGRVFTPGSIESLEFDRLVAFRVEDLGGYSSVEPRRNYVYWTTIASIQNRLLDLANVRHVVYQAQPLRLPSYRRVPFDPERPLMLGGKDTLGGVESYGFGGEAADRLQIVAALTRAIDIPSGEVVARVTVVPNEGDPAVIELRAGTHVAEWAYDRPDVRGRVLHQQPPEIAFRRPGWFELDGRAFELYLYYSEHDLPRHMDVERVDIRYTHPIGGIELYGLGLYHFETGETAGVTQRARSKLRQVHADDQAVVMENLAAFPRAYVVSRARVVPPTETPISAMLHGAFDPLTEVMLEQPPSVLSGQGAAGGLQDPARDDQTRSSSPGLDRPPAAELLETTPGRVRYRASSPEGGYFVHVASFFPGWRALVDGRDTPILLANGLFRAVPLEPGEHVVELRYEPASVQVGRIISIWAAMAGLLTVAGAILAYWLRARRPPR